MTIRTRPPGRPLFLRWLVFAQPARLFRRLEQALGRDLDVEPPPRNADP
jgi:hypothetical protein